MRAGRDRITLDTALSGEVGPLRAGDLSALTFAVTNAGSVAHRGPRTVLLALPPGVRYVSRDAGPAWDCAARDALVLCTHIGTGDPDALDRAVRLPITPDNPEGEPALLAPGDVDRLTLVIEVAPDAPSRAIIRARSLTVGDGRPGNDFVQIEGSVEGGQGDLVLPEMAEPFHTLLDPGVAPPVLLHWLPEGIENRSASGAGWACDALSQTMICTVPPLSDASVTFEPRVTVDVEVASDAPEHLLMVAGLNTVRTSTSQQIPLAGYCAPVRDSPTPVPVLPRFCHPASQGP
jgi:hypothetical protein